MNEISPEKCELPTLLQQQTKVTRCTLFFCIYILFLSVSALLCFAKSSVSLNLPWCGEKYKNRTF